MNPIADATFVAQMKRLPSDWKQPQGNPATDHYRKAFSADEHAAVPTPGCYFWPASTNRHHVDTCNEIGDLFKKFCHDMLSGFKRTVDIWRAQAHFQNLMINAVTVTGTPGCLNGPNLEPMIKVYGCPAAIGHEKRWRDAIAKGLSDNWKSWQNMVTIPGLPLYPAFASFPGPVAPYMPNVPVPLASCPSAGVAQMTPGALAQAMKSNFTGSDPNNQFGALSQAIGTAVSSAFMAWLPCQMVMGVLGGGPVPTYSPAWTPVGPVVMGNNIPAPGHLAA
jgi:hypothetical protein